MAGNSGQSRHGRKVFCHLQQQQFEPAAKVLPACLLQIQVRRKIDAYMHTAAWGRGGGGGGGRFIDREVWFLGITHRV